VTAYVRALVKIPHDSGFPEEALVNTLYFTCDGPPPDAGDLADITAMLTAAYNIVTPQYTAHWDFTQITVTYYNMEDPKPRVPITTVPITISAGNIPSTTNALPGEVSLTLSFKANYISGTNNARRRGRLYFGPFQAGAVDMTRPSSALQDLIRDFGTSLLAASTANATVDWCVHSPTSALLVGGIPSSFFPVVSGWCDNAWDTQRRRGAQPTSRLTF